MQQISPNFKKYVSEEWEFTKLSASYFSIVLTACILPFVTVLFAGNINQAHLDGVGLANTIYNVVVMSVSQGYSSVFDTYGPQVYGTSSERNELGTVLVKCLLQGGLVHLVILGPYLNLVYMIDILPDSGLLGGMEQGGIQGIQGVQGVQGIQGIQGLQGVQEVQGVQGLQGVHGIQGIQGGEAKTEDFREIAVTYLRLTVLAEYLDYAVQMILRYFAIQEQTKLVYFVSGVLAAAHILANYLLVSVFQLGVTGLGLAAIIGRIIALLVAVVICIVYVKRGVFPWGGLSMKVLVGWKPMIKLGVSGAFNVFAEVALYEISTFSSQFASRTTLSVVIILIQIMSIWWSVAFAISRASATLIGKALAEGSADKVRLYMKLTLFNTFLEAVPMAVISYFIRGYLVRIFTSEQDVIDLFTSSFWLACIGLVITHLQTNVSQGPLIAYGEQKFTAKTMSIACYLVGLPFILVTIFFTDLKVVGIFLGWSTADTIILTAAAIKVYRTNINNEIEKTRLRVAKSPDETKRGEGEGFENPAYKAEGDEVRIEKRAAEQHPPEDGPNIEDLLEEEETEINGETRPADIAEAKRVLLVFLVSAVFCVIIEGVSLLRG